MFRMNTLVAVLVGSEASCDFPGPGLLFLLISHIMPQVSASMLSAEAVKQD